MSYDVEWPTCILRPTGGAPKPTARGISGGVSITGLEQVVMSDAGFWRLTMTGVVVNNYDRRLAWDGIAGILNGRAKTALIPALVMGTAPWPIVGGVRVTTAGPDQPHSDGTFFSDGTGYSQRVIEASLETGIALRGTFATIRIASGSALMSGMHFSVNERLFRILTVTNERTDTGSTLFDVTLWPPAREAVGAGSVLEFAHPVFRARLATDDAMEADFQMFKLASPNVEWVEDV